MTQKAQPIADDFTGNWVPVPVFDQVNHPEPPFGAVHSRGLPPPDGDSFQVELPEMGPPVSGPHALKVRLHKEGPDPKAVDVWLLQGDLPEDQLPGPPHLVRHWSVTPTDVPTVYELALAEADVERITDYADLHVRVTTYDEMSSSSSSSSSSSGSSGSSSGSGASVSDSSSRSAGPGPSGSSSSSSMSSSSSSMAGPCCGCGAVPRQYRFTTSGFSGGVNQCAEPNTCDDLNGEWTLTLIDIIEGQCAYSSMDSSVCNPPANPTWILHCDDTHWILFTEGVAGFTTNNWSKPISAWNCLGANTLTLSSQGFCDSVPDEITIEPV